MQKDTRISRGALVALAMACALGAPGVAAAEDSRAELEVARQAYNRGEWSDAIARYKVIYETASDRDPARAEAALEWSSILWEQGSYREAKRRAEEALELAREIKYDAAIGRLLVTIGHIETSQGQLARAHKTFQLCASLSGEQADQVFSAICRMNLSLVDRLRGRPGMSEAQLRRDIARLESAKTPLAAGSALAKTGELYVKSKQYGQAIALLEKAQAQFEAAGSVPAQARNRLRIARALQESGDYPRAMAHIKMALGPLRKMNNRPALVNAEGLLGADAAQRGARGEALGHYRKALKLSEQIGNPQLTAQSHLALCEAMANPTPIEGVEHHCAQADARFGKLRVPELQVRAKIARANMAQRRGELKPAREQYKQAIEILDERVSASVRDDAAVAVQRANLCQVENQLEVTGALLTCRAALDALKALPNSATYTEHIAATYYSAGFAAQREERIKQSLRHFEQAAAAYMKTSPPQRLRAADARLRMGLIYSVVLEGEDEAERAFRAGLALLDGHEQLAGAPLMIRQLRQQLIQLLDAQKKWEEVRDEARALIAWAKPRGDGAAVGRASNFLASALLKLGDRAGAISALEQGVAALEGVEGEAALRKMMKANLRALEKK